MANKLVQNLFKPLKVGDITLPNRIAMAAMTRLRADPKTDVPNDLHVEYYTQRATAGLLISEGAPISKESIGVQGAASLYTPEQVKGWKKVTDAVHAKGGRIFAQLWHGGRSAHESFSGVKPIGPSPIKIRDPVPAPPEYELPREMTKDDIKRVTEEFRKAAENAKQAGFDGVELHGANGYLIDEFLKDAVNLRKDEYGGSVENRCKFPLEVVDTLVKVWGKDRVGIKLSPVVRFLDVYDSNPEATFTHMMKQLDKRGIAYVQLVEADKSKSSQYGPGDVQMPHVLKSLRPHFKGAILMNNGFSPEKASQAIEDGIGDFASFGRLYISNPDLVERAKNQWPYAKADYKYFYFGGPKGYTDYPTDRKSVV